MTEKLTGDEKKFKRELLNMFNEELQESERDMKNAIDGLRSGFSKFEPVALSVCVFVIILIKDLKIIYKK